MSMLVASLASGSSGNSYYLQSPEGAMLVDAGLSGRRLLENLRAVGGDPALVRGVIVTHEHRDHAGAAGILHRRHGWKLWMTPGTREGVGDRLGKAEVEAIGAGSGLIAGGFRFEFAATPHDSREPVAVTAERGARRCGIFTDLGHPFPGLAELVSRLDCVFLESNYDPGLLAANPNYRPPLKSWIRGEGGHLANAEAGRLVRDLPGARPRRVILSHLSLENNRPDLAYRCFTGLTAGRAENYGMLTLVAPRHDPLRLSEVD
ncbi:MAG: MBL fold metallo-hydrolase [Planctomycetota bacterium]|jgi:phosphoribosyl 1,2-cyclic phosphodiesterase|nr:MBL fold metallo-hydrolase [Planctomycetota bacterium]